MTPDDDDFDWNDPLLEPEQPVQPEPARPVPSPVLTPEEVEAAKAKMVTSRDNDPTLMTPAPKDPSDLTEVAFEIYDRKAHAFRVITRAFTQSGRLVLLKVLLDSLAGHQTPMNARELYDFQHPAPMNRPLSGTFVCRYGTTHNPESRHFLKSLIDCQGSFGSGTSYDPEDPWFAEHAPFTAYSLEYGDGNGHWFFVDPRVGHGLVHMVEQDY